MATTLDDDERDTLQQLSELQNAGAISGFQHAILNNALKDELHIVKSMAIAYLAEPKSSSLIMKRLIERYTVRLGHRYAQFEVNLEAIISSGELDVRSAERDFFIRLLQKLRLRGEQLVIMKTTLQKINDLSEQIKMPRIG